MEALIFVAILGAFYAGVYLLNHKTPVPAGCEDLTASCNGCSISSCGLHPTQKNEGSLA
jgi:hypothetical protein